jgi:hypothetical protein
MPPSGQWCGGIHYGFVIGIRRGYQGMIEGDTYPSSPAVSGIIQNGGTTATARRKESENRAQVGMTSWYFMESMRLLPRRGRDFYRGKPLSKSSIFPSSVFPGPLTMTCMAPITRLITEYGCGSSRQNPTRPVRMAGSLWK